ncbi:MAG: hypothetical protein QOE15_2458 [Acidimicrobiaceae bacterium]|nr:hypothetical protein [Acidimicrobiaceae bacterium]
MASRPVGPALTSGPVVVVSDGAGPGVLAEPRGRDPDVAAPAVAGSEPFAAVPAVPADV